MERHLRSFERIPIQSGNAATSLLLPRCCRHGSIQHHQRGTPLAEPVTDSADTEAGDAHEVWVTGREHQGKNVTDVCVYLRSNQHCPSLLFFIMYIL